MSDISTKELAERWGVSKNRILFLVKEGRIPCARRVGNSWVFPENVEKPADMRLRTAEPSQNAEKFRFPLYLFSNYSRIEIEYEFTHEERTLYNAELLFHKMEYERAYSTLVQLLNAQIGNAVRAGALYYLARCCIHMCKFAAFSTFYMQLWQLVYRDIPHQRELELLIHDLDSYCKGNDYYISEFNIDDSYHYHGSARTYLYVIAGYSALMRSNQTVDAVTLPFELICQSLEDQNCIVAAVMLHGYMAAIYQISGHLEAANRHLQKELRMAMEHDCIQSIAFLYHYFQSDYDAVLEQETFEQARVIKDISNRFFEKMQDLMRYLGSSNPLFFLKNQDTEYLRYAMEGLTNKEVASRTGQSISAVSKRYSMLYERTGTTGKKELKEFCGTFLQAYLAE